MIAGNTGSCTEFATKEWLDKFMHRLTVSPLTDGEECVHISHPAYSTPPLSMARAYYAVVLSHSVGLCTCGDILVEHLCSPAHCSPAPLLRMQNCWICCAASSRTVHRPSTSSRRSTSFYWWICWLPRGGTGRCVCGWVVCGGVAFAQVSLPFACYPGPYLSLLTVCTAWGGHQGQAEEHCTAPPSEEGALSAHILSARSSQVGR